MLGDSHFGYCLVEIMKVFALEKDAVCGRQLYVLFVEDIEELVEGLSLFDEKFAAVAIIEPDEDLHSSIA